MVHDNNIMYIQSNGLEESNKTQLQHAQLCNDMRGIYPNTLQTGIKYGQETWKFLCSVWLVLLQMFRKFENSRSTSCNIL